jgi:predicted PurR-regulated permease PerM
MDQEQTKWMKFLGGKNIIYTFVILFLIGATILLYSQLNFILQPIVTIISAVLTPIVISFILYYLLDPIIDFLESKKIKRIWGIILVYLLILGLLTLLFIWLIPNLQEQFMNLIESIPELFDTVTNFLRDFLNNFIQNPQQEDALNQFLSFFENIETNFMDYITEGISGVGSVISSVTNVFIIILMVPIILFFLLKDGSQFIRSFMTKMPPGGRKDVTSILRAIDTQVGDYIKGQIIVAIANGTLMFIGFTIIDLNYSGVLATMGGILSFIPYLGPTLTFIPAAVVALMDSFWMVGQLIIVWAVVQFIEGNLIEPNILGRSLNVHPATIIFILLIMGELLGIVGMILGVPIYAIIKVFITYAFIKFKNRYNKYYGDEKGRYETETLLEAYDLEE